ncbi:hypothetical protein C1Y40_02272 [Mycobacterium talmoniae]|nr:hypothetical protein C1Y40_02272 [Mycobacterium talmoniae]
MPVGLTVPAIGSDPDRLLANVQALTAVILNRAGMPWDAMAAQLECSKQALHRRLAMRGEKLFEEAVSHFGEEQRTTDTRALMEALYAAEAIQGRGDDPLELQVVVRSLVPWGSADLIWRLVTLPASEYILAAGNRLASALMRWRRIPRWWWKRGDDLQMGKGAK